MSERMAVERERWAARPQGAAAGAGALAGAEPLSRHPGDEASQHLKV